MKQAARIVFSLVVLLTITKVAGAQGPTATISGTVRDQTGAVLPDAGIQVTHQETGRVRNVATDSAGRYRVPALESGSYTLQASLTGFRTAVKPGIVLTTGSEVVVDLTTEVGQVTESVTVTGEVSLLQTTSAELSGLVGDREIRDLPLNGRSYDALAFLQPGVAEFTSASSGTLARVVTGAGAKMSIGGTPGDFNSFLLDGTDIHDHAGFTPGSVARNNLGVDSILEFRVLTRNYSAEHGRTAGGVISAVTRAGTNSFHGSAFEFLRNNALDAREFFDQGGTKPFRRNQFGAAGGGPIVRDRTFFFANYEGMRERLSQTQVSTVPSAGAHQGFVGATNVGVDSRIRPYLGLYPLPNGRDFGDGTALLLWVSGNPTREDFGNIRIDHQFSEKHYFFGRFTLDDTDAVVPASLPPFDSVLRNRNVFVTLEEKTIFSPNVLNVFRAAFNRTNPLVEDIAHPQDEALAFVPGRLWNVSFTTGGQDAAIANLGHLNAVPQIFLQNIFQFSDDVDYHRGAHSMKMGVNLERFQNNNFLFSEQSRFQFADITSFLRAIPREFNAQSLDSKPTHALRQWMLGFYFQDNIAATSRLNLNLGLRYEFLTIPTEVHGNQDNILNWVTDTALTRGPAWLESPSKANFAPRVGFAWTPFGEGKPVIRGGFGVYHNQLLSGRIYSMYSRSGVIKNVAITGPPFPSPGLENFSSGSLVYRIWDPRPSTPTVYQYNFTMEQQLPASVVVALGYAGSQGVHWLRQSVPNIRIPQFLSDGTPFYAGGNRINPAFGVLRLLTSDATADYNSLQLQITRRFARGLQWQTSYTWSSSISDSTATQAAHTSNTPDASLIPFDRSADRSLVAQHVRHLLTANYTYQFPGNSLSGFAAVLGKGWEMSGILTAASGNPFTITLGSNRSGDGNSSAPDRPDLKPAASNNPVDGITAGCGLGTLDQAIIQGGQRLGGPERYYDPCAFALPRQGFYGNLGRNTVIGPGRMTFNFSLVKTFNLSEAHALTFRSEFFNLFNRANFGLPNRTAFAGSDYAGNAGVIQSLATTSRQIQFGLRYSF